MSYARFGPDSDVYVYSDVSLGGAPHCCACDLTLRSSGPVRGCFIAETPDTMLDHLAQHMDAGDQVPDETLRRFALEADDGVFRG